MRKLFQHTLPKNDARVATERAATGDKSLRNCAVDHANLPHFIPVRLPRPNFVENGCRLVYAIAVTNVSP
jgi:hypothetical protein